MAHHDLKIKLCFLLEKIEGNKCGEIRFNKDRGFQKGDTCLYTAYDDGKYLVGFSLVKTEITYVTNFEQKENMVVYFEKIIEIIKPSEKTNDDVDIPF